MGPGVDPHVYKATQRDIQYLRNADLIFYNELHLEGKITNVLYKLRLKKKVYAAGDPLTSTQLLVHAHFPDCIDWHTWLDVSLW